MCTRALVELEVRVRCTCTCTCTSLQTVDSEGTALSGVLVSLSGENFRSNNFTTDDDEKLEYRQLVSCVVVQRRHSVY